MPIEKLTEVYRTSDGEIFGTHEHARQHETIQLMAEAIKVAYAEARSPRYYDMPYATQQHIRRCFHTRLAAELLKAGFVLHQEGSL